MALRRRIEKLENRPEAKRCPECGLPPDGPGRVVIANEVEHREQEYCPRCGRPLYLIIEAPAG